MGWLTDILSQINIFITDNTTDIFSYFTLAIRFILPLCAVVIVWRSIRSLLGREIDLEEWGFLTLPNGSKIPLNHWENIIGRARSSDVSIQYPTLSRNHAALIRDAGGSWRVYDLNSKSGVLLNGKQILDSASIKSGDILELGGVQLVFAILGKSGQAQQEKERVRPGKDIRVSMTLLYLTAFQVALGLQLCIAYDDTLTPAVPLSFLALAGMMWLSYAFTRIMRRVAFEVETLAFFLSTLGLAVVATSAPENLYKEILLIAAGVGLYFVFGRYLRDLSTAVKLRWPIAVAGLILLAATLVLSKTVLGAKNWLSIGGISIQPAEFVKIAFVCAGAATLDRLFAKRNLILFVAFSGACVMALALMGDFGTALVFFVAYLTISFLRSGDLATVFLSIAGAGLAGFMAVILRPYVADRFTAWGTAWANVYSTGFQQTRTMSAAASGGLLGLGGGNGWFKNVFAADTDMVFGIICEELGLIVAVAAIFSLLALAFYAVRSSTAARSTYYVIGACASASILLTQMILNIFGSVDMLPFTGVTFPFVSTGGSSMITCWGLLAFIKASDTRLKASFAVAAPKRISQKEKYIDTRNEEQDDAYENEYEVEYDEDTNGFDDFDIELDEDEDNV